jgi:hypothetical protein
MSPIEDEIRDTLRSTAASLREVRPLRLPPVVAAPQPRAVPRAPWALRLRAWQAPAVAAAVIVIVAASLVTLRSLRNEHAAPAASTGPSPAASAAPRYYVAIGPSTITGTSAIIVGDRQAGKTLAAFPVAPKNVLLVDGAASGAADDRTFVVSVVASRADAAAIGPGAWHLVRIFPGSVDPVRITKLPIKSPAGERATEIALSGDGTELAVVSMPINASFEDGAVPLTLTVYSVATGQLQHSWSAGISASLSNRKPIADLSWVGDSTVGFAVTYSREVREEVRTLDVSKTGANLLADSRTVWSQDLRTLPGAHGGSSTPFLLPARHVCDTPFLTGNGEAVVCGNSSYSPSDKRWSAVWLRYSLATPTRSRVLGRVQEPRNVNGFASPISVDWTNLTGTEVIGSWFPVVPVPGGEDGANHEAVIQNGTFKSFTGPAAIDPAVAW